MSDLKNITIAVVGAGTMGSGIAQKYATHGYNVIIVDQNDEILTKSQNSISHLLKQGLERGVFKDEHVKSTMDRLRFSKSIADCRQASLVVEAIFEDLSLKKEIFLSLESICEKHALLATNTSSFKVADIQASVKNPERVLGLHYFFHPAKNRLVEIIGTPATHEQALKHAQRIQESINKIVIYSKDSPGFIVNRFFVPWLNESMRIAEEGMAHFSTIDAACQKFFHIGMGPFLLMNITGLPITFHSCLSLAKSLGDFYAPSSLIRAKIDNKDLWDLSEPVEEDKLSAIAMRLFSVVSVICCQMVFEENVCGIADVDLGARVGLLWKKGPFELLNHHADHAQIVLAHAKTKTTLPLPEIFKHYALKKKLFSCQNIVVTRQDDVGIIKLNKPDTLNSLDVSLKNDLACGFFDLVNDEKITSIIITGHRRAFMAGADLDFFNQKLNEKKISDIVLFAKGTQEFFLAIDRCKKPVVAAVSGMALGGGLELALACDAIIATRSAKFAFPETGLGIYPGLGGTQRTTLRIGAPLARYLILTGASIDATEALSMALIDEISDDNDLIEKAVLLVKSGAKKSCIKQNDFLDLEQIFSLPLHEMPNAMASERAKKALARIANKAPLAINIADRLIENANENFFTEDLALETAHLAEIFSSEDAHAGLRAASLKTRVSFMGK